jgi:tRNA 2-thiouridine synthesizing protein B
MLHLVFQSPIELALLERIAVGDDLVFLENAVLRILEKGSLCTRLTECLEHNRLYVLADDLEVRGIQLSELVTGIEVIDYAGLVALTIKNPVIQSWS